LSEERWAEVDGYLADLLAPPDAALDRALAANAAAGLPPHDVSPLQGKLLNLLARACGARAILEIGTLGGYSTIWLARTLPADGRLVTLEADPHYAEVARRNIDGAGLAEVVEVQTGPALDALSHLTGPFDLVFIDADKQQNAAYLTSALDLTRPGALIVADNVIRDGAVADPASVDPKVQGIRRMNEILASDPRVEATTIQTVGAKGHDGFTVVLRTSGV
jgi:predicted O-methyltransferase YrrM